MDGEKRLEHVKTHIRRVLSDRGLYSKEMSYQIELLASDLMVFRKIREEALAEETPAVIYEKSREGDKRAKENPVFILMARFADRVRKDLRALLMNQELSGGKDAGGMGGDDPLAKIMAEIDSD